MHPNEIAQEFTTSFNKVMELHAPIKRLKICEHAPDWLNTDYLAHIDEREYWGKQFDKNPSDLNLRMKNQSIERTKQIKLELQRTYFNDELLKCGNDAKKKWKLIKMFWPHLNKSTHIENIIGKTTNTDMATEINEFFSKVGSNLASKIIPLSENNVEYQMLQNLIDNCPPIMELREISDYDVAILIRDLKPSISCGADGITARLLKAAGPSIVPVIRHLINRSIISRQLPCIWKIGCITPLYKDGDATNPTNYHPILILPTMGKLTEKIVHSQLYSYFNNYNLLSPCQAGFRKGHSMGTCLLDFVDNLFANIDQGMTCGVFFLDLRKAFDTMDHKTLLTKLRKYGIKMNTVN